MAESKPLDRLDFLTLRLGNLHRVMQDIMQDPSHAEHSDDCTICNIFRSGFEALVADFDRTTLHNLLLEKFPNIKQSRLSKLSFTGSLTTLEKTDDQFIIAAREKGNKDRSARVLIQVNKADLANMLLGQQEIDCTVFSELTTKGE
jgi:hypothetical protein